MCFASMRRRSGASRGYERVTAADAAGALGLTSLQIRGNCLVSCFRSVVSGLDNVVQIWRITAGPARRAIVASTFDVDSDGWAVASGSFGRSGA